MLRLYPFQHQARPPMRKRAAHYRELARSGPTNSRPRRLDDLGSGPPTNICLANLDVLHAEHSPGGSDAAHHVGCSAKGHQGRRVLGWLQAHGRRVGGRRPHGLGLKTRFVRVEVDRGAAEVDAVNEAFGKMVFCKAFDCLQTSELSFAVSVIFCIYESGFGS
ncbi:hypothetical protein FA95DRAFT_631492 [Auriscalpium vulgare]|uniref:Uncharacterized protein n=1 Tax=Auriscalpium vulgare TaxID=40419 RepID=A0ACB8RDI5_9AGAM|nr:hypothetical protein FA95DRAFT_631492 [Auriscalpium vulgare]